jgi:hypothetical protein
MAPETGTRANFDSEARIAVSAGPPWNRLSLFSDISHASRL